MSPFASVLTAATRTTAAMMQQIAASTRIMKKVISIAQPFGSSEQPEEVHCCQAGLRRLRNSTSQPPFRKRMSSMKCRIKKMPRPCPE